MLTLILKIKRSMLFLKLHERSRIFQKYQERLVKFILFFVIRILKLGKIANNIEKLYYILVNLYILYLYIIYFYNKNYKLL